MKRTLFAFALLAVCIGCKGSSTPAPAGSGNDYSGDMPSAPSSPHMKLQHSSSKPQATAIGKTAKEGGK